jgi:hypothetical protein
VDLSRLNPMNIAREIGAFLWLHKLELLIAPVFAFTAATFLHELGHAVFVWLQGGVVYELTFLPGQDDLGHVKYALPRDGLDWLVAAGPTILWTGSMLSSAALIALFSGSVGRLFTRNAYAWLFVVPLGDIAWHAIPWMLGGQNDLTSALGPADDLDAAAMLCAMFGFFALGFAVMKRGYGSKALSLPAYTLLASLAFGALAIVGLA